MPWIHVDDVVGIYLTALDDADWSGPVNATAPEPVTNHEFSKALGQALHRPAVAPIPGFAIKLLYGDMAQIVTDGQRAVPRRTLALGYSYKHQDLDAGPQERDIVERRRGMIEVDGSSARTRPPGQRAHARDRARRGASAHAPDRRRRIVGGLVAGLLVFAAMTPAQLQRADQPDFLQLATSQRAEAAVVCDRPRGPRFAASRRPATCGIPQPQAAR